MSRLAMTRRTALCLFCVAFLRDADLLRAQPSAVPTNIGTNQTYLIDLPTALRLAGARNLDIQIARQRLAEAKANYESGIWLLFPWIAPGASYRRHENLIQETDGTILDVHKQAYVVGPSLTGQLELGDAIYKNLAARQLVKAADYGLESQRLDTIVAAAQGYFDLAKAQSAVGVAKEAVAISTNYQDQVQEAVSAGIAFKGDLFRVQVQTERNLLSLRQAQEQQRVAAARLSQTLQLDCTLELVPPEHELVPLTLIDGNTPLDSLVVEALRSRPELRQSHALTEAAREAKAGALYGPLIPTLGAQSFAGGLGGGRDGTPSSFGETEDYQFTLGWRIGPGGLLDRGRIHATESRLRIARLSDQKARDEVIRQIIESLTRVQSLRDQTATAQRAVQAAEETLRLTRQRKEYAVGTVLENIQAEQELTSTRLDYLNAITEYNKAQYLLSHAIGGGGSRASREP